jgi:predicted P-loop ATPase
VREAGAKLLAKLHRTVDALKAEAKPAPAAPTPPPVNDRSPERRQRELVDALAATSAAACGYDEWVSVGMILKAELGDAAGFVEWDRWSALDADRYPGTAELARKWASFRNPESGDLVFKLARAAGWRAKREPRASAARAGGRSKAPNPNPQPAGGGDGGGGDGPPPGNDASDDEPQRLGHDDRGRPRWFPFRNDKGAPMSIRENVVFALLHDPTLAGLVAHNEFTELHERTRATPWGAPPGEWDAIDDLHLAEYLANRHGLIMRAVGQVQEAVSLAASRNKVHPLRTWLRGLVWDGTPRLDHWLVDCLGAPARDYSRLAGRMFLIGMVARVMRPGCKMDYALILQGAQGAGKSTAFRALAEPWFADTVFKIGDKDALMSVQGVWLYELSELDALSKSEHTAAKAFISSQEDRFRPPYGTRMQKVPRRVVMCGTTNADQFLSDATGDRRYWPIHVRDIDVDALRAMRDQLFAEAVHAFSAGEHWFPTREQEADLFVPEQDRYKLVDVWADYLSAYVNSHAERREDEDGEPLTLTEIVPNRARTFFSTQELISKALRIEAGRIDSSKQMQRRVSQAMQAIGFVADRQPDGKRKRGYTRKPLPAAPAPTEAPGLPPQPNVQGPAGHPPEAPPQSPDERARAALNDVEVAL